MSEDNLITFYKSVFRPVTEYACEAWQASITKDQRAIIEAMQWQAFDIIYQRGYDHDVACIHGNLSQLLDRCNDITRRLLMYTMKPNNYLHSLLPE